MRRIMINLLIKLLIKLLTNELTSNIGKDLKMKFKVSIGKVEITGRNRKETVGFSINETCVEHEMDREEFITYTEEQRETMKHFLNNLHNYTAQAADAIVGVVTRIRSLDL